MIGWVLGHLTTARTWLGAFKGPCLALAAVALLAGAAGGGWLAWRLQDGRVAKAEAALAMFQAGVAADTAQAIKAAQERQAAADAWVRQHDQDILTAIGAGFARAEARDRETLDAITTNLQAPEWACLRRPLPGLVVERLLDAANGPAAQAGPGRGP